MRRTELSGLVVSPFNNTYGFVSSPAATEANGGPFTTQTFTEYVRDNSDAIVMYGERIPRSPGWPDLD